MIRNFDLSFFVVLICGAIFLFIQQGINVVADQYGAYVAIPALVIVPSALFLKTWKMLISVLLLGLFEGSFMPVRFAVVALVWILASGGVHALRSRYRNFGFGSILWLTETVNLIILLAYALIFPKGELYWSDYFTRILADIGVSAVAIAFLGWLCISVPRAIMYFFGENLTIYEE